MNISTIAHYAEGTRDPNIPKNKAQRRSVWGLLFHTTGRGVPEKAAKTKKKAIDIAKQIYIASQNGSNGYLWGGAHYVMDHDGTIWQLAPDDVVINHCGGPNRAAYMSGSWINQCSPQAVARWHAHWGPKYKNPYDLFPSKTPNADYIGCEMIPIGSGVGGKPMRKGLLFTKAQHDAAIVLAKDVAYRHNFPGEWRLPRRQLTPRLLGHEDVQIIDRQDKGGGWDPGYLRAEPYFDFEYVRANV